MKYYCPIIVSGRIRDSDAYLALYDPPSVLYLYRSESCFQNGQLPYRALSLMNAEVSYVLRDGRHFFITILHDTAYISLKSPHEVDLQFIRDYIITIGQAYAPQSNAFRQRQDDRSITYEAPSDVPSGQPPPGNVEAAQNVRRAENNE